jgi:hypothetical protein
MGKNAAAFPLERIQARILLARGKKVLLDADLASLYGVETRVLNQAVKRNNERFPADFMFRLSAKELAKWRSQFVISNPAARMGLRRAPFAFTEHGALMVATVLNSPRAVKISVYVVRAFVALREFLATHRDISRRLHEHQKKLAAHDRTIVELVKAIRALMTKPEPAKGRPIGFVTPD